MKARVKATGEIVEVYPSVHKGCDYDGSDGYSYMKEDIIILDDEPDYWTRLEHQAAISIYCANEGWVWSYKDIISEAHNLVEKLKNSNIEKEQ